MGGVVRLSYKFRTLIFQFAAMETKLVQQALNEFGAMVVQRAQANLKKGGKFGTYKRQREFVKVAHFLKRK
jgi:hypothetical protein